MTPSQSFGKTLSRIRQDQGFPSAHAFYKARDGRRNFQMTFRNYLNVEQGKNVPKPERVEAIVTALGLGEHSAAARELAQAYLASLGLTRIARLLDGHDPQVQHEESAVIEQAARQTLKLKTVHLEQRQWQLVAKDFDAYACDDILQMTEGGLPLSELGRLAGLTLPALKRALSTLAAAGMIKIEGGRARSLFENKVVETTPNLPAWVGINAGLFKQQEKLAAQGALIQHFAHRLRMKDGDVNRLRRHVDQLNLLASLYETAEPAEDSAIYMLRGQLFRVFPRKGQKV